MLNGFCVCRIIITEIVTFNELTDPLGPRLDAGPASAGVGWGLRVYILTRPQAILMVQVRGPHLSSKDL